MPPSLRSAPRTTTVRLLKFVKRPETMGTIGTGRTSDFRFV